MTDLGDTNVGPHQDQARDGDPDPDKLYRSADYTFGFSVLT